MNDMLPVGSKVKLNNERICMIIGYFPSKPNDAISYDYICCRDIYGIRRKKEDLTLDKDYFYISNTDISEVLYLGYSDIEFDYLNHCSDLLKKNLNAAKKNKDGLSQKNMENIYIKTLEEMISNNGGDKDDK